MKAPELPAADILGEGLDHESWLAARRIGGSNAATLFDCNPYESQMSLYLALRGEGVPVEESEPMRWGTVLEQEIAAEWSKRYGIQSIQPPPITIYKSKEAPFATASPDRLGGTAMADGKHDRFVVDSWVEIKNVGRFKLDEWDEGVPENYWYQAQWELGVSGLPVCHVVALVGGQDLRWRRVERDEDVIAEGFDRAERFLKQYVEPGVEPPADGSDATRKALSARYIEKTVEPVEGGADLALLVAEYLDAQVAEKVASSAKKLAQNRIAALVREHEVGTVDGIPFVSLKVQHRGGYEVAPNEFAVLRVLKGAKA